ncbi:hypothetical protein TWF506_008932 [Arthrobotrys conoides]|uniref:Uncharacterized protein n=1 Tax=Arthrobotrys conoides TaxID=74498 RepID=A0AAN8N817_9PEZI
MGRLTYYSNRLKKIRKERVKEERKTNLDLDGIKNVSQNPMLSFCKKRRHGTSHTLKGTKPCKTQMLCCSSLNDWSNVLFFEVVLTGGTQSKQAKQGSALTSLGESQRGRI